MVWTTYTTAEGERVTIAGRIMPGTPERFAQIGFEPQLDPTAAQSQDDAITYLRGKTAEELEAFLAGWEIEQALTFGPEDTWPEYVAGWKKGAYLTLDAARYGADLYRLKQVYGPKGEPFTTPVQPKWGRGPYVAFRTQFALVEYQLEALDPLRMPAKSQWAYPTYYYGETGASEAARAMYPIEYLPEVQTVTFNLDSVADLATGIQQVVEPLAGAAVAAVGAVQTIQGTTGPVSTPVAAVGAQPTYFGGYQLPTVQPALGMPFGDIVAPGQEAYLNRLMSPFRPTMAGARAQIHVLPNPMTGKPTFFGPLGKPLTFSRDRATVKRWKRHARDAKRLTGGR